MTKYMVLRIFDYPYEDVQSCEYNGKTVFDNVKEVKDAMAQSVLDYINECGFGLKDFVNMITNEKVLFNNAELESGRLYIYSERDVEWRIIKIEI